MLLPRFSLSLCCALLTFATAASVLAEAVTATPATGAIVVLVGAAGRDPELEALLGELLERRGVHARISEQKGFAGEQLLHTAEPGAATGHSVLVFIVPGPAGSVRLYFRAPDGERFLVRNVLLRSGFDEVGRELVGQVVETAVVSLLHSGDGLTREQAQLALAGHEPAATATDEPNGSTPPAAAPLTSPAKRAGAASNSRPPMSLEGWFALRYGAVALGTELGVAHGPGFEIGLAMQRGLLLRGRLTFERDFAQSYATSMIAAEFTRVRWRFAADAGLPLTSRYLLLVSLGLGQDHVNVRPTAPPGSSLAPAAAFQAQAPVAHAELRYEAALGRFRVAAAVGADASLVKTHYDVARGAERESVVSPSLVRPNASIALALCPRWATF